MRVTISSTTVYEIQPGNTVTFQARDSEDAYQYVTLTILHVGDNVVVYTVGTGNEELPLEEFIDLFGCHLEGQYTKNITLDSLY
jgi:hypothetical protein